MTSGVGAFRQGVAWNLGIIFASRVEPRVNLAPMNAPALGGGEKLGLFRYDSVAVFRRIEDPEHFERVGFFKVVDQPVGESLDGPHAQVCQPWISARTWRPETREAGKLVQFTGHGLLKTDRQLDSGRAGKVFDVALQVQGGLA